MHAVEGDCHATARAGPHTAPHPSPGGGPRARRPGHRRAGDGGDGRARPGRHAAVARPAHDRIVAGERRHARGGRDRRQHRHPLVQRVLRPAVAAGRPRVHRHHQPGRAAVGDRLRHRLPDPGLARRHDLDLHLLHHHRHRRHPDPERHRLRPLRPHVRHRPRHPVRLQPLGVPGLRHRPGTGGSCQHHQRGPEPPGDRVLDGERRHSRLRRRRRQHRHPLVQRRSPIRSGCRSTSAPARASARSP